MSFESYGCSACHQGVNVGGNLFQRFGVFANPFAYRPVTRADLGRFALTGNTKDRFVFRVPSAQRRRHGALFPRWQRRDPRAGGRENGKDPAWSVLAPQETDLIVRFLRTLTGEYRGRPVTNRADAQP